MTTGREGQRSARIFALVGIVAARALAIGTFVSFALVATAAQPTATQLDALTRAKLGWRLAELIDAETRGDARRFWQEANNGEAVFDDTGRVELQLHLRPSIAPVAVDDKRVTALGGRVAVRGIDVVNVWLPMGRVQELLRVFTTEVAGARLPFRPHALGAGKALSQGADLVAPPAMRVCTGNDGAGATVVVLDTGFEKWAQSRAAGELPGGVETADETGGTHGTMCAQVVADVAPGAKILPVPTQSFAGVQQLVKAIEDGNPDGVDVISHSVIWFGQSFGRHEGPLCAITDRVRKQGVAWVNASGNSGGGGFWSGVWTDKNKDNHQDFGNDGALLRFRHYGGEIKLVLDWDDYALRETNLDLSLYQETATGLELVSESKQLQGVFVPTVEQVIVPNAGAGKYAAVVTGKKTHVGLRLRIVSLGGGSDTLSVWHNAGNVYDPASCEGVLTIGAMPAASWDKGVLAAYSSYGPTVDGRQKPELVAPTEVETSIGGFGGTSAACPHAAGAIALAVAATSVTPVDVVDAVLAAASPIGPSVPHPAWGWGRLVLDLPLSGWQCEAATQGIACATSCGGAGVASCDATCRLGGCEPPGEICVDAANPGQARSGNGVDEDCDGVTDEGCDDAADVVMDGSSIDGSSIDGSWVDGAATDGATQDLALDGADGAAPGDAAATTRAKADSGCQASTQRPSDSGPAASLLLTCLGAGLWMRRRWLTRGHRPGSTASIARPT